MRVMNFGKGRLQQAICVITLTSMINIFGGCSVVGFTGGTLLDEVGNANADIERHKIDSIRTGKKVTVYLRDGTEVHGKYRGLAEIDSLEYESLYSRFCGDTALVVRPPHLSENISLVIGKDDCPENRFRGFGYCYQKIRSRRSYAQKAGCYYVRAGAQDGSDVKDYYLNEVKEVINSDGSSNRSYVFAELIDRGELPLLTRVVIATDSSRHQISYDDIDYVQYTSKNAKWVGLGVGLGIDIMVLLLILADPPEFGGWSMQ
jgi:hypothetical protein